MTKTTLPNSIYDEILEYISLETAKQSAAIAWSHGEKASYVSNLSLNDFFEANGFEISKDFTTYVNKKLQKLYTQIVERVEHLPCKVLVLAIMSDDLLGVQRVIAFQNTFKPQFD